MTKKCIVLHNQGPFDISVVTVAYSGFYQQSLPMREGGGGGGFSIRTLKKSPLKRNRACTVKTLGNKMVTTAELRKKTGNHTFSGPHFPVIACSRERARTGWGGGGGA